MEWRGYRPAPDTLDAMRAWRVLIGVGIVSTLTAALMAGCSADDDSASESTFAGLPEIRAVTVPPERRSPFCEAIFELDERLDDAPADADIAAIISDAYSAMLDDVPAEIRDDFLAVLADLQTGAATADDDAAGTTTSAAGTTGTAPATSVEDFEEGYLPDDTPALRLNSYVQFTCRDSQNNPGPPETEPLAPLPSTTAEP